DLAGDDGEPGRDQRLAGDAAVGIVGEHGVEHRVGDLVGDLVRMPFRDRFRGEGERATHRGQATWRPRAKSCALRPGRKELRAPEIAISGALRALGLCLGLRGFDRSVPSRASRLRVLARYSAAT